MTTHRVDKIEQEVFDRTAALIALNLQVKGFAFTEFQPGDGTLYRLCFVQPETSERGPRFYVSSSMGQMYPWDGQHLHWDYVADKWVSDGHPWTARIFTRLFNSVSDHLDMEYSDGR